MNIEPVAVATPARALRQHSATVTLLRRPLLLAFMLGCAVSLLASGRLTLRLVIDGTLSFAFVPACELIAFALVHRLQRGAHPFGQAADRYLAGNVPWLWWLLAMMTAAAVVPAHRLGSLLAPILFTSPIPIALSVRFDWRLFRGDGLSRRQSLIGILLQRVIAWPLATAYFLGLASSSRDFFYLFVEMGQEISAWTRTML